MLTDAEEQLATVQDLLVDEEDGAGGLAEEISTLLDEIGELREELSEVGGGANQMNGIQSASGSPTADQLYQIERSYRDLPAVLDRTNGLITTRMSAVLAQVYQAGVRPEAAEALQMPRR